MNLFRELENWLKERKLDEVKYNHLKLIGQLTEEICEGIQKPSKHESIDWRCDCIVFLINSLTQDGYDAEKCLNETLLEIKSRTGHYDESIGKFVKDTSDEAKAKWYKANYDSCKLEE